MDSSENIVERTYTHVEQFLENLLGSTKMQFIKGEVQKYFPSWSDLWFKIQHWLKESDLTNMQKSIHSFAELFPNYNTFSFQLDQSLTLHDEFWNQVHYNLCVAKDRLPC